MSEIEIQENISIKETRFKSLVLLKVWPDHIAELQGILSHFDEEIIVPLMGKFFSNADLYCVCISPGQYMFFSNNLDLFEQLSPLFTVNIATLTDLSHSRCAFQLKGNKSTSLLNKGLAIDLDGDFFPIGSATQSTIHSMAVLLLNIQKDEYLLLTFSSLAGSFSEWLLDASKEY